VHNGFFNDWNPKFSRPTNYDINEVKYLNYFFN
jgi:hypothetical protein